mmetsp:Transcript_632/g.1529  ORF Transcript_632/g.1529 Transcript_632/m.1529 type:complete len:264 (-) Transcript_632:950-1741(-)
MHWGGLDALVNWRPRLEVVIRHGEPAGGPVAQELALHAHLGRKGLLLGALKELHDLVHGQGANLLGARAGKLLLHDHLLQDAVVLGAGGGVDGAGIALGGHPPLHVILHALALHTRDAALVSRALDHREDLPNRELPEYLAVLDVQEVSDRDRCRADVVLVVQLGEGHALLVLHGEPALGLVGAGLATQAERRREDVLTGPLDELQDLIRLDGPDRLRSTLARKVRIHLCLLLAAVEGLCHVCEEGSALVAHDADPSLHVVNQ